MRTLNVFLASSEELDYYRMSFGNLVRRLDNVYEKRGVRIRLFEWEDYDAAYNDRRKQDEYNDFARRSDMFIAMFGEKANRFTLEEFDVALEEFCKRGGPKVYVYCEELEKVGKHATKELEEFQTRLSQELGYYWFRYDNRESMQFQFVMQLQHLENGMMEEVKVEGGNVVLDGLQVARMENLRFASANEDYQEMSRELAELPIKIDEARLRLDEHPEDEDLVEDLQRKLDKYNDLKGRFEEHQQLLFQAAIRVAKLQGEMITERMRDAMHALDDGRVRDAIDILDLAEEDAHRNLEGFKRSEEDMEQKRQMVFSSIDELLLKASSVMADASVSIEDRIKKADKIYIQADEMAQESEYDKEKYIDLLLEYLRFLDNYSYFQKAMDVAKKLVLFCETNYGKEHPWSATSYEEIGGQYFENGDYGQALKYYLKAVKINKKLLGEEHPNTATTYNRLSMAYLELGNNNKALFYGKKAIKICEKIYGTKNTNTGKVYENYGNILWKQGNYAKALDCYLNALFIFINEYGEEHTYIATTYDSIGLVYFALDDLENALMHHQKALDIQMKMLGLMNQSTASTLNNIGSVYWKKGDQTIALQYLLKALDIREIILGLEHPITARTYDLIGNIYYTQGDYETALDYYLKALLIFEKVYGFDHPATGALFTNVGNIYWSIAEYDMALEYYMKDLIISEKTLDRYDPDLAYSYNNIGNVYMKIGNYKEALKYHLKAMVIKEKALGIDHSSTATTYDNIGYLYYLQENYKKALKFFIKAAAIRENVLGIDNTLTVASNKSIGDVYLKLGDKSKAEEYFSKSKR
jgi:tetratricopeptide (TPR) repeat protein